MTRIPRWGERAVKRSKDKQGTEALVEKDVSFIEKLELAWKLGALILPLTYVSGYLISTSYLGTYGIQLSASDLLRTKYIYIGFLYITFVAFVGVVFWAGMRAVELWAKVQRSQRPLNEIIKERAKTLSVLDRDGSTGPIRNRRRFQKLRGKLVVTLIVIVFTIKITFLNPGSVNGILPLQNLFLLAVAVYQSTFYIGLLEEPFAWGLTYGRRYIEDVRWSLWWAQVLAALGLLSCVTGHMLLQWLFAAIAFEIVAIGAASICINEKRLKALDELDMFHPEKWEQDTRIRREVILSLATGRSIYGMFCGFFSWAGVRRKRWSTAWKILYLVSSLSFVGFLWWSKLFSESLLLINALLMFAPLALSVFVMVNVGIISLLVSRRNKRLGYKPRLGDDELWSKSIEESETRIEQWDRYGRRGIMASVLYVTSVMSFGYVIYPHIPYQKSGGNYNTARPVCVELMKDVGSEKCPTTALPPRKGNEAYIELEEDSDRIYLANENDAGGRDKWIWAGLQSSGNAAEYPRPPVYAVSRSCVAAVSDVSPIQNGDICALDQTGERPASKSADPTAGAGTHHSLS